MLLAQPQGGYRFLPGGYPYSSGVVSAPGYEIVHATFQQPIPYREGFSRIAAHLERCQRPKQALCGVELRSPYAYTRVGFAEFNHEYRPLLEAWDLLVDGENPVARTNVVPVVNPPAETLMFGFSYTVPADPSAPPTFVVAGGGEMRGGTLDAAQVVRPGDASPEGMREKAAYVMHVMSKRLEGLGVGWAEVNAIQVYTAEPLRDLLTEVILPHSGPAAAHGVRWHLTRPPIDELDFEMDVRGVRTEIWL